MILEINKIKKLIPHRKPFLFIEKCKIIEIGKIGEASKIFYEDEYFFEGHFPDNPIVPGVVLVEAMAQTAGIVVTWEGFGLGLISTVIFFFLNLNFLTIRTL